MDKLDKNLLQIICKNLKNKDLKRFGQTNRIIYRYTLENKYLWIDKLKKEYEFIYRSGDSKFLYKTLTIFKNKPWTTPCKHNLHNAIKLGSLELVQHYTETSSLEILQRGLEISKDEKISIYLRDCILSFQNDF